MVETKVFGIGFHKTGTSSLSAALSTLGYRITGPNWVNHPEIADTVRARAFDLVDSFDAFQDNPWPILYRDLDRRCPGAKFILTVRDADRWIRSVVRHFGRTETPMRRWIYGIGSPVGHEEVYVERYERHNAAVLEHFEDRPEDLLVMDITRGHSWDALCTFLGRDPPDAPFPHVNRSSTREWALRKERLKRWLRPFWRWR